MSYVVETEIIVVNVLKGVYTKTPQYEPPPSIAVTHSTPISMLPVISQAWPDDVTRRRDYVLTSNTRCGYTHINSQVLLVQSKGCRLLVQAPLGASFFSPMSKLSSKRRRCSVTSPPEGCARSSARSIAVAIF